MLDDKLIEGLEREAIRLLRVEWLLAQPDGFKLPRRQDLEILERSLKGVGLSPLLRGEEAVALMRNGEREVGALSYGWLLPWDPDPTGERMALLRLVLSERPYIKALFWDQATLYQPPRSKAEEAAFQDALLVMMDLYASAIGTTCALQIRTQPRLQSSHDCFYSGSVLQIKDIPTRPAEFDGLLCLGGVRIDTKESAIRESLQRFGEIDCCTPPGESISLYQVKFKSHAAAEMAATEAPKVEGLYDYASVAYKSVPYDELDSGGTGRGWSRVGLNSHIHRRYSLIGVCFPPDQVHLRKQSRRRADHAAQRIPKDGCGAHLTPTEDAPPGRRRLATRDQAGREQPRWPRLRREVAPRKGDVHFDK